MDSSQILIPLRHYIYPGNVAWTQEGQRFSWRMKLRSIKGKSKFTVVDNNSGEVVKINNGQYLTARQARKISCRPDMILQFAHYIGKTFQQKGMHDVSVYSKTKCSLNGRKRTLLIDPRIDLTKVTRSLKSSHWILHNYE